MLAGIFWFKPENDIPEARTNSDQAPNTHTLGPLLEQHSAITWALITHAHALFFMHLMLAVIFCRFDKTSLPDAQTSSDQALTYHTCCPLKAPLFDNS